MSAVLNILISLKHGSLTQAQAAAEIEELIELERLQLRDTFAVSALTGLIAEPSIEGSSATVTSLGKLSSGKPGSVFASAAYVLADAMLEARKETCTKSQTLAHYEEQARLAKQEGGAK